MSNTIIIVKTPGEAAYKKELPFDTVGLDTLQELVGGYIQIIPLPNSKTGSLLIMNEEGKMKDEDDFIPNILIPHDIIVGTVVVAGNDYEGEIVGLNEEQIKEAMDFLKENHLVRYNRRYRITG